MLLPWTRLGLLALYAGVAVGDELVGRKAQTPSTSTTIYDPACTANVTVYDTTTIVADTTVNVTHYLDVFVNTTTTCTVEALVTLTEYSTTTLHFTVNVTDVVSTTLTSSTTVVTTGTSSTTTVTTGTVATTVTTTGTAATTVTTTGTASTTVTTTGTAATTVTTTGTAATTVTTTGTASTTTTTSTTTTQTLYSTTYDPCPQSCSISAGTVNLYFWPTNRPYTYPSTYVDTNLGYTFTSPSVYMLIPTAKGINTLGQSAGPETTQWILPLDLYEVSTVANGTSTRQLTLADIGTDCPQTADPTAIATLVDSRCDPVLAAPRQVSSWAYPCNACGRFGLFDPPYAIPTLTGSLVVPPPTTTVVPPPVTITAAPTPTPTSAPPVGILLVVYCTDGTPVATATITSTGISGTVTSTVNVPASATVSSGTTTTAVESSGSATAPSSTVSETSTSSPLTSSSATPTVVTTASSTSPSVVATAGAERVTGGLAWLIPGIVAAVFLL